MTDQTLRQQIEQTIFDRIVGVNCQHQHAARSAANAAAESLTAHLRQQDSWRTIEATPEMMHAGVNAARKELPHADGKVGHVQIRAAWNAMLAAAPSPNSQSEGTS